MKVFVVVACALFAVVNANNGYGSPGYLINYESGNYGNQIHTAGNPSAANNQYSSGAVSYSAPGHTFQAAPVTYAAPTITFYPPPLHYSGQSVTYASSPSDGYDGSQSYQPVNRYSAPPSPIVQNYKLVPTYSFSISSWGRHY